MSRRLSVTLFMTAFILLAFTQPLLSQTKKNKTKKQNEFYFSWGYNKEWYTHSTVRVMQPSLGNDYKIENFKAHDHPGWDKGIFDRAISIPQYNYRLGFYNNKKNWGFEINFDHTKFIIADQDAHIVGTLNNRHVDTTVHFSDNNSVNSSSTFYYYLNNGANFLLFNFVKRWHLTESRSGNAKIDLLGKAGVGPLIPHVENMLFGKKNDPHFQLGGWNVGAEAALRATFYKSVYLEYCNKLDFASYSGLRLNPGTARQMFGTYEMILNVGIVIPYGKTLK